MNEDTDGTWIKQMLEDEISWAKTRGGVPAPAGMWFDPELITPGTDGRMRSLSSLLPSEIKLPLSAEQLTQQAQAVEDQAAAAEARVAQLEAALRELLTAALDA